MNYLSTITTNIKQTDLVPWISQQTYHGNIGGTRSVTSFRHAHKAHNASGQAGNESLM